MKVVVIGAQWGDEGKGKIVDYLAGEAGIILRFSGGANAGHTIVADGSEYALHLVPSGALYKDKRVILGAGMVVDPAALFNEIELLSKRGVDTAGRLFISDRAHLVLPRYIAADKARDAARSMPIGTTGRGIGEAYRMKSERGGVRAADLDWAEMFDALPREDRDFLSLYREHLLAMRLDVSAYLHEHRDENILFEGAQGTLLDLDLGTYPYVSSGMSGAAGAAFGGGVGPKFFDRILGVCKAYSTRVGNGPFPTEFNALDEKEDGLCRFIREAGREYGVTTGRPRRCGYLDLVALRYACRCNSLDSLVMTHLDVYDSAGEIKVCEGYDIDGVLVRDFPASITALDRVRPVLRSFRGWNTDISGISDFDALPEAARDYIAFIEDYCETPVSIVSVGCERAQTIIREDVWRAGCQPSRSSSPA
ncbi:MAG: adenylosuccinate synthase [Spirochaetaceae bacterium]|jgi:adenylosuccinate synthase|nr:adenylosuccinate synthase [Spirochaetaceae bacterium]